MNDQLRRQLGERLEHPDTFAWLVDQLPASETSLCLRAWGRVHGVYPAPQPEPRLGDEALETAFRLLIDPANAAILSRPDPRDSLACRVRAIYVELQRVLRDRPISQTDQGEGSSHA